MPSSRPSLIWIHLFASLSHLKPFLPRKTEKVEG